MEKYETKDPGKAVFIIAQGVPIRGIRIEMTRSGPGVYLQCAPEAHDEADRFDRGAAISARLLLHNREIALDAIKSAARDYETKETHYVRPVR